MSSRTNVVLERRMRLGRWPLPILAGLLALATPLAGQAEQVAQDPEQGHVRRRFHLVFGAIDGEFHDVVSPRLDSLTVLAGRRR